MVSLLAIYIPHTVVNLTDGSVNVQPQRHRVYFTFLFTACRVVSTGRWYFYAMMSTSIPNFIIAEAEFLPDCERIQSTPNDRVQLWSNFEKIHYISCDWGSGTCRIRTSHPHKESEIRRPTCKLYYTRERSQALEFRLPDRSDARMKR